MGAYAGAVFGVVVLVLFVPPQLVALIWFQARSDRQPIKARYPALVVAQDIVLLLYMVAVCAQRIIGSEYPCWLNLWSSYVGTIILCNVYLVRCFTLAFNFRLTQERLADRAAQGYGNEAPLKTKTFYIKNRRLNQLPYLAKWLIAITLVLLIPCAVMTATENSIMEDKGDNCHKGWANYVLAGYVAAYVVLFLSFAWDLRKVADGFFIKTELRITGLVGAVAVLPWVLFNTVWEETNTDVFPFSTLAVVLAVLAAFFTSTIWPLYRTWVRPPPVIHVPENINSLAGLLSDPVGFESFRQHLANEFSPENLLFWVEVERFRKQMAKDARSPELLTQAQAIYSKYVMNGAPFWVNLPESIRKALEKNLKEQFGSQAKLMSPSTSVEALGVSESREKMLPSASDKDEAVVTTIFDDAQRNIFHLMQSDSYQRYIHTQAYQDLSRTYQERKAKKEILLEMGVI